MTDPVFNFDTFFVTWFGSYNPVTYEDPSGNLIVASGAAGVDWVFIGKVALFLLLLYMVFTFIRMLISR